MTNLILSALDQRTDRQWIWGADSQNITAIAHQIFLDLTDSINPSPRPKILPKILLCEPDPAQFIGRFMGAVAAGCPIFLGNPHWATEEWHQVFHIVQPDLIWGDALDSHRPHYLAKSGTKRDSFLRSNLCLNPLQSAIMIPTGGSSGKIRFAIHTWDTLTASVQGFTEYFQLSTVNSFCLLPLYHVSGLMQFLRSLISGGSLVILPSYKEILTQHFLDAIASAPGNPIPKHKSLKEPATIDPIDFFISLVPTQLARLLQQPIAARWLSKFKTVLLGGAPAWPELLNLARQQQINLAPTYGMTETASQVVTLKPEDFLAGNNSCGRVLPHAQITICDEQGQQLDINHVGTIAIRAKSLTLGYYPPCTQSQEPKKPAEFMADDLGFVDADGFLTIAGRHSDKIITGGENVFPAEVEAAIRTTGLVRDVCAIALSDPDWGEAIAAVYIPSNSQISDRILTQALKGRLAKFKQPKYWVPVAQLPRNSQGKVNRAKLSQIVEAWRLSQPE